MLLRESVVSKTVVAKLVNAYLQHHIMSASKLVSPLGRVGSEFKDLARVRKFLG
jgi:hypothetical protein